MNKFTRRELAAALSASAVLLSQPASAQSPQPQTEAPPPPVNPAEELKAAEAQIHDTAAQLDKFPLPMATEPVTVFKP
jgi:hypothetical protein